MDTRFIEVRKNVTVSRILAGESSFNAIINIPFIPDEVTIKMVRYDTAAAEDEGTAIYTDLVNDIITSFYDNNALNQNIVFTLRKPVFGMYNFQFLLPPVDENTQGEPFERTGNLFIHMEFVKYKNDINKIPNITVY
jgi:hypothetical protein